MMPTGPLFPATANLAVITGSQVTVPRGSLGWSITVISGAAYVNGEGPINPPWVDYGTNRLLSDLNVGATGAGHKVIVRWDSPPTSINI